MRWLLLPLAAVSLIAAGCGASSDPPSSSGDSGGSVTYADGGTFTMVRNADPGGFDPYRTRQILGLSQLAYDSLVYQRLDGDFVSNLAEEWTVDAQRATFTLRDDVTCSDGTPMTASQVAAGITFASDPANQSPQYGVNTPAVAVTATPDDAAGTVEVVAAEPFGFLLHTIGQLPIVCAAGMDDPDQLATSSAGTGPFVLSSVVPGQSYTFTRREGYAWGPDGAGTDAPGTPDTVVIRIVENETTAANLLLSGEVNVARVTGPDQQRLQAQDLATAEWKVPGVWLSFNHLDTRPTADPAVRRALVHALDLEELIRVNTGGTGTAATSFTALDPKGCPDNTIEELLPEHDVAAAEELLDEAGWIAGPDGIRVKDGTPLTVEITYITGFYPLDKPTAELLAEKWHAIGVRANIRAEAVAAATTTLYQTSNWDVYLGGYSFNLPSQMVPYLSGTTPPNGNNIGHLRNAEYDRLAAQAVALTPPEACTYWDQAEQAILREVDVVPIADKIEYWYLNGAEVEMTRYDTPIPTTIRMLG
ncbi:ABC transporter substrate-binding protein [Jiangella anatolica]|uniref:Peptide ABC transporter substrate-binding protein n=1 Tax=Jiangella anatolica TaxID=2670374 RepID=A0A2W2CWZ5_9ACTN|nr:ABC transporter substrate-binding protein [Jiangella anatolica]PZF84723.1 peptide ABC transporter substrate-binding protein [Jiangella anatolica]